MILTIFPALGLAIHYNRTLLLKPFQRGKRIYTLCHVSAYIAFLSLPVAGISSLSCSQFTEQHSLALVYAPTSAHEKAAAYTRSYTVVIVFYARYIQLE